MPSFPQLRAEPLAARLELDLDNGICHACLSFVCCAMDDGDVAQVARETRRVSRDLWSDGLAEQALAALRQAAEQGEPDAPAALADLERNGGTSCMAQAIVRRLAAQLQHRTRVQMSIEARARDRLRLAPPELN
jgi:uncharacterized protein YfcZ (UPF0381/DUF406 family)